MKISNRIDRMQTRINDGAKSGELTNREEKRMERRLGRIAGDLAKDRIDGGGLTEKEQRKFDRRMDNLGRDVKRNKNDGQSSFEPSKKPGLPGKAGTHCGTPSASETQAPVKRPEISKKPEFTNVSELANKPELTNLGKKPELTNKSEPTLGSINDRFGKQGDRIEQGVESGQLTTREARALERAEMKLAIRTLRDMFDGGGLTAKEKAAIDQRQDALSGRIYDAKHDDQVANG